MMWIFEGEPNGMFSWQHWLICAVSFGLMFGLGIWLGIRDAKKGEILARNKVLIISAVLIVFVELTKLVAIVVLNGWKSLLSNLPLFLCSLSLFTLPLVCVTRGKFRQAMADMIFVFGVIMAFMGVIFSGLFDAYPAFSFFPLNSVFTHCVSGFASVYIGCAKLFVMDGKTLLINLASLSIFSGCAWLGAIYLPQNYMYLNDPGGTPFSILWNWFDGNAILYPLSVIVLQLLVIVIFYGVVKLIRNQILKQKPKEKTKNARRSEEQ